MPSAKPAPTIGPIKGEISMAPMITAFEFTLRPTDAITIAQANIHKFGPLKVIFALMFFRTFVLSSSPLLKLKSVLPKLISVKNKGF
jgi:hypothetical protein